MGESALTVRERIIVHLSAFNRFADEFECPEEVCQSGISMAIGKSRAHTTLELNRMVEANLIHTKNAHVKGAKSKRKTYFLSPTGLSVNAEINKFLDSMSVQITDHGRTAMLSGTEAVEYLRANHGMPRVLAADSVLASDGILEPRGVHKLDDGIAEGRVFMPPRPKDFLPRKEMGDILGILNGGRPNTIMLLGIPGIGKTSLLSELAWNHNPGFKVMYRRLYPFDSQMSVLADLAEFLEQAGDTKLRRYLEHSAKFDLPEAGGHLAKGLSRDRILLIFDEYELASATLRPLFSMLMELVRKTGSSLIVSSARKGNFYSMRDMALENAVAELTVGPMDDDTASKLMANGSTGLASIDPGSAGGHPLTLKLLAAGIQLESLAAFVEDDILGKDTEMSKICRFCSVLRKPFSPDDLELFGFGNSPSIRRDLVFEPQPGGGYMLHPAISSIMAAAAGKRMLRELHSRAAEFYIKQGADKHEALHHLIHANRTEDARAFIIDNGEELLATDNIEELAGLMELALWDGGDSAKLKVLAAEVFDRAGKWEMTMKLAGEAAKLEPGSPDAIRAQILHANMLAKTGNLKGSLTVLDAIPETAGRDFLAKAQYARASALRRMGRNKDALKACKKANSLSKGDARLSARCVMESASIMAAMGEHDEALEKLEMAIQEFEKLGSVPDRIRCGINLGMILRGAGRDEEAATALEKAVDMSEKAGLDRFRAHALVNLTDLLNRKADFRRSEKLSGEAMGIFSGLGEPVMQAAAMLNLCGALSGLGKRKRAIAVMYDAIAILEKKGLLKAKRAWVAECADMLRKMGEDERAKAIIEKYG